MKRPSFQFYPADWRNNAKLRRCSEAARGAWMDILCVLHDFDEYGICRWPLADLARSANVNLKLVKELVIKDVLKGGDSGAEPYIFTPRHAGKDGTPVVLAENNDGPLWYCTRFVRDEYIRQRRGNATQFSGENQPPKPTPKESPKPTPMPPIGERQGDGPTSSSTSTLKPRSKTLASATRLPTDWQPSEADILFCRTERPDLNPRFIADGFKDYWAGVAGAKGKKEDWPATWRNWIRNQKSTGIAGNQKEQGRSIAAASVFKPEHTQHLNGNMKEVEYEKLK